MYFLLFAIRLELTKVTVTNGRAFLKLTVLCDLFYTAAINISMYMH